VSEPKPLDPGINWRQVSRGLLFMGLGVFLLLNTQGRIPWSFWLDALAMWPVLLVALGLRLVFDRSRLPWAVLLSPVLILGTLTYLAIEGPKEPARRWHEVRASRSASVDHWALEGRLMATDLQLEARPIGEGLLVEGQATEAGLGELRVSERDRGARVRVERWRDHGFIVWPRRPNAFRLGVTQDLPLELDFDVAFASGTLDVTRVAVEDVRLEGAFNALTLRLGRVAADRLGEVRLRFAGAFSRIEIHVPPDTPVKIRVEGPNLVDTQAEQADLEGPGYSIRIDGAFNRVVVLPATVDLERAAAS
jgi:hypothetical protein